MSGKGAKQEIGVTVHWRSDRVPVQADVLYGLAVHRVAGPRPWQVTHVASGLSLGEAQRTKRQALMTRLQLLAMGIEWDRETVEEIRAKETRIRAVLDGEV